MYRGLILKIEAAATLAVFTCICCCVWDRRSRSSVKSKSSSCFQAVYCVIKEVFIMFSYPHCQMLSHSQGSWCMVTNSIQVVVQRWSVVSPSESTQSWTDFQLVDVLSIVSLLWLISDLLRYWLPSAVWYILVVFPISLLYCTDCKLLHSRWSQ